MKHMDLVQCTLDTLCQITNVTPELMGDVRNNTTYKNDGFLALTYRFYNYKPDCHVYLTYDNEWVKVIFATGDMCSSTTYSEVICSDYLEHDIYPLLELYFKKFDCLNDCI